MSRFAVLTARGPPLFQRGQSFTVPHKLRQSKSRPSRCSQASPSPLSKLPLRLLTKSSSCIRGSCLRRPTLIESPLHNQQLSSHFSSSSNEGANRKDSTEKRGSGENYGETTQHHRHAAPTGDPREIEHFNRLADGWIDPDGAFSVLHDYNPTRVSFIQKHIFTSPRFSQILSSQDNSKSDSPPKSSGSLPLSGVRILDVGCGGGILSRALVKEGAEVVGLDLSFESINAALAEKKRTSTIVENMCGLVDTAKLSYRVADVSEVAEEVEKGSIEGFDAVVASEVIEHVKEPSSFVGACSDCIKDGGSFIVTTLNRTPENFLYSIVMAEYVMNAVPKGTHDWKKFITPEELIQMASSTNLIHLQTKGLIYLPVLRQFIPDPLGGRLLYMTAFRK